MEQENRVVVLIDMDCFYCQVEEKLDPELKGKPIAVVQYNPWKGGGIIAVNYEARAKGVTRGMRGDEAKAKCPDIQLPSVPCQRGKADITKYRDAGKEVARVLQKFTQLLERASIDEAYLDITAPVQDRLKTLNVNEISVQMIPNTFALGYDTIEQFISDVHGCNNDSIDFDYDHAKKLLVGAVVVSEIRAAVFEETGYRCSAGIAHNKILAKLVCGMNKPNKQTILPKYSINILYKTLSLKKVKHLGGKFGDTVCEVLRISKMGELQRFTEKELQSRFDVKNGTWLYNIARGVDLEPVQARFNPKSIGCCKQFRGKSALLDLESLKKWLKDLGDEIEDRLEKDAVENNRTPKQMVVSFSVQGADGRDTSSSRSYNFVADDDLCGELFTTKALELVLETSEGVKAADGESNRRLKSPIKFLGISVGKFEDNTDKKTKKIVDYFAAGVSNTIKNKEIGNVGNETSVIKTADKKEKNQGKDYIMQKFLQVVEKGANNVKTNSDKIDTKEHNLEANPIVESSLQIQESFFAKFLNTGKSETATKNQKDLEAKLRSTTPLCNVVNCGDDSNDTDYSGSTINNEINNSIALFEEDPQDIARVSNMRDLLNSSHVQDKSRSITPESAHNDQAVQEISGSANTNNSVNPEVDTFECSECGKNLPYTMFDTHADYHLALQIREEERRKARDEKVKTKTQAVKVNTVANVGVKKKQEPNKNETAFMSNFFEKISVAAPTEKCLECGKRVSLEKYTEHLDFHEAQKLSREINKKTNAAILITGSSVKRKKKPLSPIKKSKLPCASRSIDSFFK